MHVVVGSNLWELAFSIILGPRDQAQGIRLGSRCLPWLSHHIGPQYTFLTTEPCSPTQSKNIALYHYEWQSVAEGQAALVRFLMVTLITPQQGPDVHTLSSQPIHWLLYTMTRNQGYDGTEIADQLTLKWVH